jgi:CRP-like cAMP-binding protein
MNDFNFTSYLTSNIAVDEILLSNQMKALKRHEYKKGEILLQPGDHCKHSFYVEKGLLRYYSVDDKGKEHILYFAPEGWLVTDRESICLRAPTEIFIEALENSTIVTLEDSFINSLAQTSPEFTDFNTRLLIGHIKLLQNRIQQLLIDSAEERYLKFISIYPDLLLRVPQRMVAAYLGITPESLSRVRKDLAMKNFKR